MKAKRLSKVQRLSKARRVDIISTLPQSIIEIILCLLPIEEAARTSILSREWRYKWTAIPKLVFLDDTVKKISTKEIHPKRESMDRTCKLFSAIHQVLLLRQVPILDFTLAVYAQHTRSEIDQIILHLSRNHTVKKLRLDFSQSSLYGLPLSFFSLQHLTDLHLVYCDIYHKPIFNGFSSLTSLYLDDVWISKKTLLHLLSKCPSLKSLYLFISEVQFEGKERPNIMELFKCLPVIEHLTTWSFIIPAFVLDLVPQGLPTSLIQLKSICFQEMSFVDAFGLAFIAVLLKCSPNLEKIEIEIETDDDPDAELVRLEEYSLIFKKYSDVRLKHLNELKIKYFRNFKPELELAKYILLRSPNLKKVTLSTYIDNKNEALEVLSALLIATCASQAKIVVENICTHSHSDDKHSSYLRACLEMHG